MMAIRGSALIVSLFFFFSSVESFVCSQLVNARGAPVRLWLSPEFYCFSRASIANFTAWEKPSRPPDLVSMGQSQYWDEGEYVVRNSHHWSGQNGIDTIVDSYWTIDAVHEPLGFLAGKCLYEDFDYKKKKKKRKKPNRRR